ncbi:hypothetical protein ACSNOI_14630 [Actinomadura kijaniata]|uniref:hypothetical protein n=1 Tax=Actinomadura kijaniata TaxID=46161 RepID=UPI003F1BF9F6
MPTDSMSIDPMPTDPVSGTVRAMARREAAAALLPAPRVEWGAKGPSVRPLLVPCPVCGAHADARGWAPPFDDGSDAAPVLRMLACESVTARAVLPIVVAAERFPALRGATFRTRALAWAETFHRDLAAALEAIDAAERWVTDPGRAAGRTLPASTRRRGADAPWTRYRRGLVPSFLSPHPDPRIVPPVLETLYAQERRAAIVAAYRRAR